MFSCALGKQNNLLSQFPAITPQSPFIQQTSLGISNGLRTVLMLGHSDEGMRNTELFLENLQQKCNLIKSYS